MAGLVRHGDLAVTLHGPRAHLRRARPPARGATRWRARTRSRGRRCASAEERALLRRLRGRRAAGPVRVDAARPRVRRHRHRAHGADRRARRRRGPGRWGGDAESHAGFPPQAGERSARRSCPRTSPTRSAARARARSRSPGDRGPVVCPCGGARPSGPVRGAARGVAGARRRRARRAGRAHRRRAVGLARTGHGRRHGAGHGLVPRARSPGRTARSPRARSRPRSTPRPARSCAVTPERLVWWKGWSSGSAEVG